MDDVLLGSPEERSAGHGQRTARGDTAAISRAAVFALLTLLLVAVAVPLVPGGTGRLGGVPASAAGSATVTELPTRFRGDRINNNGLIAGLDYTGAYLLATWTGDPADPTTVIPGTTSLGITDFNDAGEMFTRSYTDGTAQIVSAAGNRVLPQLSTQPKDQIRGGWGPNPNGRSVGLVGFRTDPSEAGAVEWLGSASPTLITELATVMAVAPDGLTFGIRPGGAIGQPNYGLLVDGSLQYIGGLPGYVFPQDLSSSGYVVGTSSQSGAFLWKGGTSTNLGAFQPTAVTERGVVSGTANFDTGQAAAIRAADGKVSALMDLIGPNDVVDALFSVIAMNDRCDILAEGNKKVDGSYESRRVVVKVPNCAADVFSAEAKTVDGSPVINRPIDVELTLSSESTKSVDDLTLRGGVGLVADPEELEVTAGPTPEAPASLSSNGTVTLRYTVVPKVAGKISVAFGASGTRNGEPVVAEGTLELDAAAAGIGGAFFRLDGFDYVKEGESTPLRLRVANETGVPLTDVRLGAVTVEGVGDDGGVARIERTGADIGSALEARGPGSLTFTDYELSGDEGGPILLKAEVTGKDDAGKPVEGTISTPFKVRDVKLLVNLTLDPETFKMKEDNTGDPESKDVKATISFTNRDTEKLTDITLQSFRADRTIPGQQLSVEQIDGPMPTPLDPIKLLSELAAGETSEEFPANFKVSDDGEIKFSASATAGDAEGNLINAIGVKILKAEPEKFIGITTKVTDPPGTTAIKAGSQIVIDGTVKNLSNSATLRLGPLFPTLAGNTGNMSLAYDGVAPNPRDFVAPPELTLDIGESKDFQVRIETNFSQAKAAGAEPSGGTRAIVTFEPWGVATLADETEVDLRTYEKEPPDNPDGQLPTPDAQVKAESTDLRLRVSVDDSVTMPAGDRVQTTGAALTGVVEGLWSAGVSAVYAIPDILKAPYTVLHGVFEYQATVWDSFTEEEKEAYLADTSAFIVAVLLRNATQGSKDAGKLYDQVYDYTGKMLTDLQNEWETGDYAGTARKYGQFAGEVIGNVAGPVAIGKLAKSPIAVRALERAQAALQAKMGPLLAQAAGVKYVDNVLPILQALENGTELDLPQIAKLFGIAEDEASELQRIADRLNMVISVRSRHASSIQWIKKFGAMLKPEALKLKSVSELDVQLGYKLEDLGSVVFKKPQLLKDGTIEVEDIRRFVSSKGIPEGSNQFDEAVKRVGDRIDEWNKYEKKYKQYNEQGWLETTFNYEGNNITSDLGTMGQRGKFTGFKMVETSPGSDEFVVQLLDGRTGKYRRVTGDIDPISFTYPDGSPLTESDHRKVVEAMKDSPILRAQHPESATFTRGGVDFTLGQFKPNEPAIQFGPNAARTRVARINPGKSQWKSADDYHLHWEGGFYDIGLAPDRAAAAKFNPDFARKPINAPVRVALPLTASPTEATVGRCTVNFDKNARKAAAYMAADGLIHDLDLPSTDQPSELHQTCFSEGDPLPITIAPSTALAAPDGGSGNATPGSPIRSLAAPRAARAPVAAPAGLAAGSTAIAVVGDAGVSGVGGDGFVVGQEIAIGAGTDRVELAQITSIDQSSLGLAAGLRYGHDPGEVVVMNQAAPDDQTVPTSTAPPTTASTSTSTVPGPTPTTDASPFASGGAIGGGSQGTEGGPTVDGPLPRTGSDPWALALFGAALVGVGAVTLTVRRRRRIA